MSRMISQVSTLSDHCMSTVISDVLTSNDHPFNVSRHSRQWQCHLDNGEMEIISVCVMMPRDTWSLKQDRNVGSGVNSWPWSLIGIVAGVSVSVTSSHCSTSRSKKNSKSYPNLKYEREKRASISIASSAEGETTTDWFLIKLIPPARSVSLLDAP